MNHLIFKWYGEGFNYGQKVKYLCLEANQVELIFAIHKSTSLSDEPFIIERTNKNANTIVIHHEADVIVDDVHLIKTDDDFRKKFKHSYYILKFVTRSDNHVITIGVYSDSDKKLNSNNCYLLCTQDFINLLASSVIVREPEQLVGTTFEPLKCLFSKKELAIELLKQG